MSVTLLSVLLFILICTPTLHAQVRCKIPEQGKMPIAQKRNAGPDESERVGGLSQVTMAISPDADKSPPEGNGKVTKKKPTQSYRIVNPYRQSTFLRNPNTKTINRELDKIAQRMFMLELPLPHPGAQAGSSNGCDQATSRPTDKFIKISSL